MMWWELIGQLAQVQGHRAVVDHRLVKLAHQLGIVAADALGGDLQAVAQVRAAGKIEHHLHERFVEGAAKCPKREMPRLSPRALARHCPKAMPTSSLVW